MVGMSSKEIAILKVLVVEQGVLERKCTGVTGFKLNARPESDRIIRNWLPMLGVNQGYYSMLRKLCSTAFKDGTNGTLN